jgi:hypothetical protein
VIHAFALEPQVVATWAKRDEFRFIHDKFGFGAPRALLELPGFSDWKKAVYAAAGELELSQEDWKRLEELFRIFGEHRCRRAASVYSDVASWLESAEAEYARRSYRAIVASENPRRHGAVILGDELGQPKAKLWACELGATPSRSSNQLATTVSAMLGNCRELHLVDPHFGPENARHRKVLEALLDVLASHRLTPDVIRIHCAAKSALAFFEQEATSMANRLPNGYAVEFVRWKKNREKLHNRYILTDLGGVSLGVGIDAGDPSETDDILLLPRAQYEHRWAQYVGEDGAFERVDTPATVRGSRAPATRGRT